MLSVKTATVRLACYFLTICLFFEENAKFLVCANENIYIFTGKI